jgi:hypothetical protein
MTRHFLGLYLLIVVTLAAVSWGQDRLLQSYGTQEAAEDKSLVLAMTILENQLRGVPSDEWKSAVAADPRSSCIGKGGGAIRQQKLAVRG